MSGGRFSILNPCYLFKGGKQVVKKVDTTSIKFNQASIITLTLLAYLFNWPWLVLFVGAARCAAIDVSASQA